MRTAAARSSVALAVLSATFVLAPSGAARAQVGFDPGVPNTAVPPAEPKPASSNGGGPVDRCASQVRIVPPSTDPLTGEQRTAQLWTQCQDNEFMILEVTNGVWPEDPLPDASTPHPSAAARHAPSVAALLPLPLLALVATRWRRRGSPRPDRPRRNDP